MQGKEEAKQGRSEQEGRTYEGARKEEEGKAKARKARNDEARKDIMK